MFADILQVSRPGTTNIQLLADLWFLASRKASSRHMYSYKLTIQYSSLMHLNITILQLACGGGGVSIEHQ